MMRLPLTALILVLAACRAAPPAPSPAEFHHAVRGNDWVLVTLGEQESPRGAGGRQVTLRFDADSARVSGFSGCNQYFARYTLGDGAAITFRQIGMTRMACSEGMELESQYAAMLGRASRYALAEGRLTLLDGERELARFARAGP